MTLGFDSEREPGGLPQRIHTSSLQYWNCKFTVKHPRLTSHLSHTCPDVWPSYSL